MSASRLNYCLLAMLLLAALPSRAAEDDDFALRPLPGLGVGGHPTSDFLYLFSSPARWPGTIGWSYNPAGATAAFSSTSDAVAAIAAGAAKWAAVCGVQFSYLGTSTVAPDTKIDGKPDLQNVVGWAHLGGGILGDTSAYYNPAGSVPHSLVDTDIALSIDLVTSGSTMDRVATHEWGHALGLGHSNLDSQVMSGTPDSQYNSLTDLQPDDIRGCRCLYGMPAGQQQGYICSLPRNADFGTVDVATTSDPQTIVLSNGGNAPLALVNYSTTGPEFSQPQGCNPGTTLSPGSSCTLTMQARASTPGSHTGDLLIATSDGIYDLPLLVRAFGLPAPPVSPTADVVEYYHAALDHYFMTSSASDIQVLDAGVFAGWQRTGHTFKAFTDASSGASPVCRFYLPPRFGDSHFYSAFLSECAEVRAQNPHFVYESPNVMYLGVPDQTSGACDSGTVPVYRVWDMRVDTNHRYMTDRALRDQMVALGWVKEGAGPDAVVMCAPQ